MNTMVATAVLCVQVIKLEKREPRKSVLKPRLSPRNDQAEAEKCFQGSLFSTEITWTNLKSDVDQISSEESSQHNF